VWSYLTDVLRRLARQDEVVGRDDQRFLNVVGLHGDGQFHDLGIGGIDGIDGTVEGVVFRRWPQVFDRNQPNWD
jgi:hypothetical protein